MIKRKILSNGMTVVFKERKNGVVAVSFAARYGGINEKAEHKGIAHFIEHMLYKGTPKRNAQQISMDIERNGGELNGFTSEQCTTFWCKIPSKHLDVALDVLSDMVKNPLFDEKEVDKERQVIFEEMKMYQDNPQLHVFERIKSLMYRGDFSISLIGTKESMNSNSSKRLKEFFSEIYTPQNMILCVVGEADFDYLCDFAEKTFVKDGNKIFYPSVETSKGEEIGKRRGIDQANMILAYHVPLDESMEYTAQVLSVLMAGGMSSRLFAEIREKRNLAYAVKAFYDSEGKYAYSGVYVGTTPENVDIVRDLIVKEFKEVSESLDKKELESVKDQIIGNYFISQEDSFSLMYDLLKSEIKGDAKKVEEFVDNIRNVRLEDVKKLANIKDWSFFALVPE
ncbi:insulinase family protein [Candidatus Pacearchaeota archaeon]|nr:insulinase family protein [Candidatus Pacearchaeota archaeon]